jgi:hypothetical protein
MKKKKPGKKKRTTSAGSASSKRKPTATIPTSVKWCFRERSKQDGRGYGNAALYATPQTVESLVRETGQNSLDATPEGKTATIRYRLVQLPQGSKRRGNFFEALRFEEELGKHLTAVSKGKKISNTAARLRRAIAQLDEPEAALWLLAIEDYGANGLVGEEFDPESNFCALIRDVENSKKENDGAGGSFGLGSKTLWSCSNLLTVLFASEVAAKPGKVRLIGKADLGFHDIPKAAEHGYVGHGHFGLPFDTDGAESAWIGTDSTLLRNLCLTREAPEGAAGATGTTALIVAFENPSADEQDAKTLESAITRAVARNFWPAIVRKELRVFVRTDLGDHPNGTDREVDPGEHVPSLIDAYRHHVSGEVDGVLGNPGDVVSVPITHVIPASRKNVDGNIEHPSVSAEARLIIRLADANGVDSDLVDTVALVRGRAMVVKYLPKRVVAFGARPFHAILAAGKLVSPATHQHHAEAFLRYSEPPSHDEWEMGPGLRARYEFGAGARLKELFEEMTKQLREYVGSGQELGDDMPEALRDIFRIQNTSQPRQSAYRLTDMVLTVEGDKVAVSMDVELPGTSEHQVRIGVAVEAESGRGLDLSWISFESNHGTIEATTGLVKTNKKKISVKGRLKAPSSAIDLDASAFNVSVRGVAVGATE